ncbi:MAG: PTS sugar transporter subunit IIA [Verrucomicrobiae bacterium]|nr:PTS sugar transporter subunit IIA [Verrucomicrobiae bacterium]
MKVSELIRKEFVKLDLRARSKEEAIQQVAQLAKQHPYMGDFPTFCRAMYEREANGSTSIGNGVAIPHARTDQVKDMMLVVGRLVEGVKFEETDVEPVRLVFLVGTPKRMVTDYLRLVGALARYLSDETLRKQLLEVSSPEILVKMFEECESRHHFG